MREGMIPSVSPMDAGDPDREAQAMNPNRATLRPGSRYSEGPIVNPGSTPPAGEEEDLGGQTPTSGMPMDNLGARAAGKLSRDKSKASQAPVAAEPMKKAAMAEEIDLDEEKESKKEKFLAMIGKGKKKEEMKEEIEVSEELEAFISDMMEEGYSEDEIAQAIEENFEIVESSHEDDNTKMKETKKHEKAEKKDMKEHVDALLEGEQLSEEFRAKAEAIFESAVSTRVQEELSVLEEAYAESLEEEVAAIHAQLTEQVDDYLNYVVEQWVAENEIAIESGLRSELTEDFISGLRNLFAEHYIDVPEDKVSIVEELGTKVEALETKLNEEIDRNVSLTKMINESKQFEILVSACDGLTNTQAEKLKALAENVSFSTPEEFAAKVYTLKESYFPTTVRSDAVLDVAEPSEAKLMTEDLSGPMAAYVRTLGKSLPR